MGSKSRRNSVAIASFCYFIAVIFLILILIGNTYIKPVLKDIYFFRLDVSDVIPVAIPNAVLLNSVARSLGLHDFYQVGLWNYCQGYNDEGFTECTTPKALWWFNPIEILADQLLSGASIALPSEVNTALTILRIGQHVMFGFFLAGICLAFILMIVGVLAMRSRWWSLPLAILSFIEAVLITVASIVGTAMSVGAQLALTAQDELNLRAEVGVRMLAFMWISAVCTIVAFFIHAIMGCCCRRDKPGAAAEADAAAAAAATTDADGNASASGDGTATGSEKEEKGKKKGLAGLGMMKRPALPEFVRKRRGPKASPQPETS